jgi:hypothetical protein
VEVMRRKIYLEDIEALKRAAGVQALPIRAFTTTVLRASIHPSAWKRSSRKLAHTRLSEARMFFGYGVPRRETEDRTASSIVSTASSLLKPLPRSSERQV